MSPTTRSPGSNMWIVAAVATVLVLAVVIAVSTAGADNGDEAAGGAEAVDVADLPQPEVTGQPLPTFQSDAADTAQGTPAPAFTASTLDGKRAGYDPAADGPTLLLFLAHWCPHCQREVPVVQDWLDGGGLPDGVNLLAVATAIDPSRPNYPPTLGWNAKAGPP